MTNPATGQTVLYGKQEQLTFIVTAKLTRYWSLQGTETLNLTNSTNLVNGVATPESSSSSLYASLSAIYQDECMAFVGAMTQSGITNGAVTPGVSVLFSVVFKNLGEIGGTVASFGGGRASDPRSGRRSGRAADADRRDIGGATGYKLGAAARSGWQAVVDDRCGFAWSALLGLGGVAVAGRCRRRAAPRTADRGAPAGAARAAGRQYAEMRIAAVVNDEVISVADLSRASGW